MFSSRQTSSIFSDKPLTVTSQCTLFVSFLPHAPTERLRPELHPNLGGRFPHSIPLHRHASSRPSHPTKEGEFRGTVHFLRQCRGFKILAVLSAVFATTAGSAIEWHVTFGGSWQRGEVTTQTVQNVIANIWPMAFLSAQNENIKRKVATASKTKSRGGGREDAGSH